MKYLLLSLLILVIDVGCNDNSAKTPDKANDEWLRIAKIDSCEYVIYGNNGIVHSGNCHNPKHLK